VCERARHLQLGALFLEQSGKPLVLGPERIVLVLQPPRDSLKGDVSLDLALFEALHAGLELCELFFFALPERALGGSKEEIMSGVKRVWVQALAPVLSSSILCCEEKVEVSVVAQENGGGRTSSVAGPSSGADVFFFGFLPGLGFGGITHSLDAAVLVLQQHVMGCRPVGRTFRP
jgi:hypothetical protein